MPVILCFDSLILTDIKLEILEALEEVCYVAWVISGVWMISNLGFFHLIWKNYVLYWDFDLKRWIVDLFHSFHSWKNSTIRFSSHFSIENNYYKVHDLYFSYKIIENYLNNRTQKLLFIQRKKIPYLYKVPE